MSNESALLRSPCLGEVGVRAPGAGGKVRLSDYVPRLLAVASGALLAGCLTGELDREQRLLADARAGIQLPADDLDALLARSTEWGQLADLSSRVTVREVVAATLARNPDAAAALERWVAALERPAQRLALPDPSVAYGYSSMFKMHTVTLEQGVPFPGKLLAEARAALAEAQASRAEQRAVQNLLREQAVAAVANLALTRRSLALVDESVAILARAMESTSSRYRAGAVPQSDVLRTEVDHAGLRAERAMRAQEVEAAESALNALLDRPIQAPLGAVEEVALPEAPAPLEALFDRALASHPDLAASRSRWDAADAMRGRAEQEWIPDFVVGGGYVRDFGMDRDEVEVMAGISLPLWWTRIGARIREAEADVRRVEAEARGARNRVLDEVRRARSRVLAAREAADLLRGEAVPKASQNVQVSEVNYAAGNVSLIDLLDAQRSLLMRQLELARAEAELVTAGAALERAVGGPERGPE